MFCAVICLDAATGTSTGRIECNRQRFVFILLTHNRDVSIGTQFNLSICPPRRK